MRDSCKKNLFENQVNDECKVGQFADTHVCIKQNTNMHQYKPWLVYFVVLLQPLCTYIQTSAQKRKENKTRNEQVSLCKAETKHCETKEEKTKQNSLDSPCLHARRFFFSVFLFRRRHSGRCYYLFLVKFSELIKFVELLFLFCCEFQNPNDKIVEIVLALL